MTDVITATGLVEVYGETHALDGLDLAVPEGTVTALLGPNGAGKTTAVRILATLLEADAGSAEVAGIDLRKNPAAVRAKIGLSGQYAAVNEFLTGYENLEMVGRLYGLDRRSARERGRELLERFALTNSADRPVKTYRAGCAAASTSPARWWPERPCCSSTSPPPASTRAAAPTSGT